MSHRPRFRLSTGLLLPILIFAQAVLVLTYDAEKAKRLGPTEAPPLLGAALLGFRAVVADLMWIESDRYFHDGRYELALVSLNTAARMDPKFVQAWALAAWHLIYNFKLVPEGFQLLKRGLDENQDHYRLHFEMAFHYFFKLENFPLALAHAKNAILHPDRDTGEPHPSYVERLLAHCYEEVGGVDNWRHAIDVWAKVQEMEPADSVPGAFTRKLNLKIQAQQLEERGELQEALRIWDEVLRNHSMDRNANEKIEILRARLGLPIRPHVQPDRVRVPFIPPKAHTLSPDLQEGGAP